MRKSANNVEMQYLIDELRVGDTWRIFKILSEFVEGFENLANIDPAVSIFGSARVKEDHKHYALAREIGARMAKEGITVMTGGGPGIMEAANRGAYEHGGKSVGINIELPFEQNPNPYVNKSLTCNYFFVRKVMLVKYSNAFIVLPGGFGTMDEFFEALTLVQTKKILPFPLILVDKSYWGGMMDWIKTTMLESGYIGEGDLDLIKLVDDPVEVLNIVRGFLGVQR